MHKPRALLMITLALAAAAIPAVAQSAAAGKTQDAAIRKQIDAAEQSVGKAIVSMDFSALEKLWSPRMLVNSPGDSVLDREEVFQAMRENYLKYSRYENTVESFRVYGDIAVLMGHEIVVQTIGPDAGKTLTRRYSDVWQRANGSWIQIARQATYIRESQ